ncbi:D-alanyl-D-alanine carboxypeptidase (penicillin-binding protein 5/6) [Selenomonas ruminantium]|uniref:serine-type D-Ala-D-Ala carboxypeptidase n=1 Tax=Selenomonas ruminantium TaxID=971 RepID=A0A1M6SH73_SELRU|nr:D-alanyl-D-alanine carboxypeptidase family protein [Selenomonas ruminantium]SHK44123.1 D-alanyl-D-alanine carboxypeptidase (penicillin-binding protein 5/6) [Selenomonas ruminantium]
MRRAIAYKSLAALLVGAASFSLMNLPQVSPAFAEVQDKVYVQPERPEIPGLVVSPADPLQKLTARSAIVMDAVTGQVLYERDIDARRYPASTTKMMTLIVALERGKMDDIVTVSKNAEGVEGSTLWLVQGDKIPLSELLAGMMMHSGNDATVAVAEHIAGSVPAFVEMMNEKAAEIGAYNTHFVNPNGLPDDNHYTTAFDLAKIAAYGYSIPHFEEIVSRQEATYEWVKDPAKKLRNENQMLWLYRGANGVKTGYTEAAGRCLVSAARRDGMQLVAVVLDSYYMWNDSIALLDYGFRNIHPKVMVKKGEVVTKVKVADGRQDEVELIADESLVAAEKIGETGKVEKKLEVPEEVVAPIKKGDVVGKVVCYYNGKRQGAINLLAAQDVAYYSFWDNVLNWLRDFWKGLF